MFSKSQIVGAIQRTARQNGGIPLGKRRFEAETGIRESDWSGRYWSTFSEAQIEAGFSPNRRTKRYEDADVFPALVALVRRLGRFPTRAELRLAARTDTGLRVSTIEHRHKTREAQIAAVADYCAADPAAADVLPLLSPVTTTGAGDLTPSGAAGIELGEVYLLKAGRYYKVGRTNAAGRRGRELAIQLPMKSKIVHVIRTDDPVGIERYWHSRFGEKRQNGEFFALDRADIDAFRRRKFM